MHKTVVLCSLIAIIVFVSIAIFQSYQFGEEIIFAVYVSDEEYVNDQSLEKMSGAFNTAIFYSRNLHWIEKFEEHGIKVILITWNPIGTYDWFDWIDSPDWIENLTLVNTIQNTINHPHYNNVVGWITGDENVADAHLRSDPPLTEAQFIQWLKQTYETIRKYTDKPVYRDIIYTESQQPSLEEMKALCKYSDGIFWAVGLEFDVFNEQLIDFTNSHGAECFTRTGIIKTLLGKELLVEESIIWMGKLLDRGAEGISVWYWDALFEDGVFNEEFYMKLSNLYNNRIRR